MWADTEPVSKPPWPVPAAQEASSFFVNAVATAWPVPSSKFITPAEKSISCSLSLLLLAIVIGLFNIDKPFWVWLADKKLL